jgi:hypothetical protein
MPSTIGQIFGVGFPVCKRFTKSVELECSNKQLVYGVELEIENTQGSDWVIEGMHGEEDGSLRNNGYEYITTPMTFSHLAYCLQRFFAHSRVDDVNYSDRCSVHVHANCVDLTVDQLSTVVMLYQTFEKILFEFIGNDRDKNIFCVPWSETQLNYGAVSRIANGSFEPRQWQKYTALNLIPLRTLGTIEFRHMAGTSDLDRILRWCNLIGCLFYFASENEFAKVKEEIIKLNTNSFYRLFLEKVFTRWSNLLLSPKLDELLEDGVLQMKYSVLNDGIKRRGLFNPFPEGLVAGGAVVPQPPNLWEPQEIPINNALLDQQIAPRPRVRAPRRPAAQEGAPRPPHPGRPDLPRFEPRLQHRQFEALALRNAIFGQGAEVLAPQDNPRPEFMIFDDEEGAA